VSWKTGKEAEEEGKGMEEKKFRRMGLSPQTKIPGYITVCQTSAGN